MSYNVDTWKTKELVDLKIPVDSFFKHERKDWHPERINKDDGSVVFMICESEICGTIEDDILIVSEFEVWGEGSGTALNWIIEPALEDSTGKLIASRVWEGGDSIDQLTVENGKLNKEHIVI